MLKKFTSRKFLMALATFISVALSVFYTEDSASQFMTVASQVIIAVSYITGESIIDAKAVSSE